MTVIEGPWNRLDAELADTLQADRMRRGLAAHPIAVPRVGPLQGFCGYCGIPCFGATCKAHEQLARIERRARGEIA